MSETKNEDPATSSAEGGVAEACPSPFLFSRELDRLLAVAEALLVGKKAPWEDLLTDPGDDREAKKSKPPASGEGSLPPSLVLLRGRSGHVRGRVATAVALRRFLLFGRRRFARS